MLLKKRLIVDNGTEPTAVLINDEGEEYPVFLESLHNTIIFPTLMESGYKITSLPYGFCKDGVTFDQLPIEKYTPTDVQLEQMYNSIGAKMPYDEIKSHLDVTEAVGMATPPVNFTIHTREEFIEYLKASEVTNVDDDFMPLNYFVAPEARFELKEYMSLDNHRWVAAITARREMSLSKFHKLVAWLRSMNLLGANYSAMDVLDAYFAWGMDGLKFTTIARHRESRPFRLSPSKNINAQVIRKTQGFIDGAGNMLTPENERDVAWKLPSNDPSYVQQVTEGLGMNDTKVIEYRCNATQDVTIMEGTQFNITYSTDLLIMQLQTYSPIRVKSPTVVGEYIELKMALPNRMEELYDYCTLQALARMLYDMRKPRVHTSSYDALTTIGANPQTAINYILTKYDMTKERKIQSEDEAESIPAYAVDDYLSGKEVSDYARSLLEDILTGTFSIDNVGNGKRAEAMTSTDSVFNELYAIHHVMGISLEDIYNKIRMVKPEDKTLVFSNGSYQHIVDVSPLKMSINGYLTDVQSYDIQCADECSFFTFITMAAREVGADDCIRHVGVEFYMVNRSNKQVRELLDELVRMYEDKVTTTIADVVQQAKALRMKNVFALSRYFEIALKGTMTWSKQLGGATIVASAEQRNIAVAHLETKIENLTALCGFSVNSYSSSTLSFNAYCTNAYLTPTMVIPRSATAGIREVQFFAAWMDLQRTNPDVYAKLIELGVLPAGFVAWSMRYYDQRFIAKEYDGEDDIESLLYYFESATEEVNSWPTSEVFKSATHPIEYMFPGIVDNDKEPEICAPRQGAPVVRFGVKRDITLEDYRDKLYPSTEIVEKEQYIKPFSGFSAEAFMLLGNSVFSKIPAESGESLTVMPSSESIYVAATGQVMSFTRIPELDATRYPIVNLYGRVWLLRATDGKLWEVRI